MESSIVVPIQLRARGLGLGLEVTVLFTSLIWLPDASHYQHTFGLCSLWHLAAVSVVKCTVIVRPLTHFTTFTNRVLRAVVCTIWAMNLVVGAVTNVGVTGSHFNWNTMMSRVERQHSFFGNAFAIVNFVLATLVIMTAYVKVFRVVRRQVRSIY